MRPEGKYWEMSQVSEHYNTINPTIEEPEAGENILNKKYYENMRLEQGIDAIFVPVLYLYTKYSPLAPGSPQPDTCPGKTAGQ